MSDADVLVLGSGIAGLMIALRAAEYGVEGDERSELSVFYFGPEQAGQSVVEPNITLLAPPTPHEGATRLVRVASGA